MIIFEKNSVSNMKKSIFAFMAVMGVENIFASRAETFSPALEYVSTEDEALLVYKSAGGEIYKIFDCALKFDYRVEDQSFHRSADGLYSVVPFSESGVLEKDDENHDALPEKQDITRNLCAFVRLSDGCVTSTELGAQCSGEWREGHAWKSTLHPNNHFLFENTTTVARVYNDYIAEGQENIRVSSPRILAYLMEGTGFDNLLACDPPTVTNLKTYIDLRDVLRVEGDGENAAKITDKVLPLLGNKTAEQSNMQ